MSWSATSGRPTPKHLLDEVMNGMIPNPSSPEALDQLRTAKAAAKLLAHNVPGPYIYVTVNGHANGVGSRKKEGFANDAINVSVTQVTEEDLKYYQ